MHLGRELCWLFPCSASFYSLYSRSAPENDWCLLKIGLAPEEQREGERDVKTVEQKVEKVEREEREEKEEKEEEKEKVWRLERETEDTLGMC